MVENKEELLDELYALRAGLSVVSEEHDKMAKAGVEADESIKVSLSQREEDVFYCLYPLGMDHNTRVDTEQREERKNKGLLITWNRNGYVQSDYAMSYQLDRAESSKKTAEEMVCEVGKKVKQHKIAGNIILCFALVFFVTFIVCIVRHSLISIIFGIATALFLIMTFIQFFGPNAKDSKEEYKDYSQRLENSNKFITEYPAWEENAKQIVFQMEAKINPMIDKCDNLLEVLRKTYSLIIDERDWQYLDLIIFYLETGRADNMKEALILVEREVQTQRIIDKIEEATQRICTAIENAAYRISRQLGVISAQLSVVTALQTMQVEQYSRMIRDVELNNALIAKANVNSQKLMKDVAQIKSYCKK